MSNDGSRALQLALPRVIPCADAKRGLFEHDLGRAGDRRPHGGSPGEGDLVVRERSLPEDLREGARNDGLHWNHGVDPNAIRLKPDSTD
jgi:hypothetical protein